MAKLGLNSNTRAMLNGKPANLYVDWQEVGIRAIFEDEVQPSLDIDTVTFVNEEAKAIRDWVLGGLDGSTPGIFEGMPYAEEVYNINEQKIIFEGILDLADEFKDFTPEPKVECKLKKLNGQDNLKTKLESITFGYLESLGKVTDTDYTTVKYQVIKKTTFIEILVANITLFLLIKELQEAIKEAAKAIADVAAHAAGGITGGVAAAIFAVVVAAIRLAYLAIIVVSIIDLVRTLVNTILPPLRDAKTIKFDRALEIVSDHLGYSFVSPITEFNNLYYLPSNLNLDVLDGKTGIFKKIKGTEKGIPNSTDYGYFASEMFELAQTSFNADKAVISGELHLRAKNDPWWVKTSTWVAPSHIPPTVQYNTDELIANRLLTFQTDITDEWTIDNFQGTNYEVQTDAITTNDERAKTLKGQRTDNINVALGNVKEELTALEKIIFNLAKVADSVTKVLGKTTNLAKKVAQKKNTLKISQNDYNKPKLIWLDSSGKVPSNHRQLWSAGALWEKYGSWDSFVDNNFNGQKYIYNNVTVPFGFVDFCQLIENSYFTTHNGETAKATELFWKRGEDTAELSYYVRKPYTKNLEEIKIEPDGT